MSYLAKHYVNIAGQMYTPGEIIDREIAQSKLQRLIRLGAVAPCPGAAVNAKKENNAPDNDPADKPATEETNAEDSAEETEAEEREEAEAEADEYEEADAPEIDVMDGIVAAAETEEPAPKKTTKGRKKA